MKRVSVFLLGFLIVSLFLGLYVPEVKANPSFGYETKGSSSVDLTANTIRGSEYTCSQTGTADSVTAYLKQDGVATPKCKFAIYLHSDSSLVAYTEEWTLTADWDGWKTLNIVWGGTLLADTVYVLVHWFSGGVTTYYDAVSATYHYESETYNGFPNPASFTHSVTRDFSIFCNYTVSGAQEYMEEFTETTSITASLYVWKALFEQYTETITVTSTSYGWKEKTSFYMESTTITEQLNKWIELRRFFTETITITETSSFGMELLLEITEFTETITVDASLFLWKAKQFITQETVSPIANFYDWIELKMTIIEFSELIELDAIMILTFEIIALEVEPSTFGTLGVVIAIIALAIAVTAFAAKTRD